MKKLKFILLIALLAIAPCTILRAQRCEATQWTLLRSWSNGFNALPDVMHYDYDVNKTMFIDSTPERFFLFFPNDWHIAKINTDKESQTIRVIVVKLDYIN